MTAKVRRLTWRGAETIDAASAALADRTDVEVHLPAGYHHAVCTRFESGAAPPVERVAVAGGAELLSRFAEVRGLEELVRLEAPTAQAQARIQVVSPSPTVVITCGHPPPPASP